MFSNGPYRMDFSSPSHRAFRYAPSAKHAPIYLNWLKNSKWKNPNMENFLGIFDLIQLSKPGLKYDESLLSISMHFWEGLTNTLQLKCDMLTPTLFDVASITGLSPTGETFDPTIVSENIVLVSKPKRPLMVYHHWTLQIRHQWGFRSKVHRISHFLSIPFCFLL